MSDIGPILIAEDDRVINKQLTDILTSWGYEVISVADGKEAFEVFTQEPSINFVITDWIMPRMDGIELCKNIRVLDLSRYVYIVFLTGRSDNKDVVEALNAGGDDYLKKPFEPNELRARIKGAERILKLEKDLREKNSELIKALVCLESSIKTIKELKGLIPICMYCKKVRKDDDYWQQLEMYLHEQSDVDFSHSICPECFNQHKDEYKSKISSSNS